MNQDTAERTTYEANGVTIPDHNLSTAPARRFAAALERGGGVVRRVFTCFEAESPLLADRVSAVVPEGAEPPEVDGWEFVRVEDGSDVFGEHYLTYEREGGR